MNMYVYASTLVVVIIALLVVLKNYISIRKPKKHTTKEENDMFELAKHIREGAKVFMRTEYGSILPFKKKKEVGPNDKSTFQSEIGIISVSLIIGIFFILFIESTSGITFILGGLMSSAAVFIGMSAGTYANYRVARRAFKSKSVGRTVWTALKGGSIAGLSVQAFGTLGITLIYIFQYVIFKDHATGHGLLTSLSCDANMMRCTTYSLGCSTVAMFNRVAGGNFTKSADISSDYLDKLRHDLPEDDPRIPNVLADFIGDMVNDIAGNCSDLLESYVATLVASQLIANIVYGMNGNASPEVYAAMSLFPIVVATIGLFGCTIGIIVAMLRKNSMSDNPAGELNKVTYISASVSLIGSLVAAYVMFGNKALYASFKAGWLSPFIAAFFGIASGVIIGKVTEIYTSTDYGFVKKLAEVCPDGAAFLITLGDALGFRSCLIPGITISISIILSYVSCGFYGIAIASLGMLSFVGATVSIDAFGPIADNAGGIAEGCHLGAEFRAITDKLDATGNTTAAIGKGFAIGSAAYATVSLIFSYVGTFSEGNIVLNMADPKTLAGGIAGACVVAYFMFMLMRNTIENAVTMAEAGDKQLTENPGILEGTVKPDYNTIIEMATRLSIKKMSIPSLLAIIIPGPCILLFGFGFVGGFLVGATIMAIPMAIYMGNSGGAFDNAKKYIEEGLLVGYAKGSDAHKVSVIGDTTGDTRKDVVGVDLDIFIKMIATSANTIAPVLRTVRLVAI